MELFNCQTTELELKELKINSEAQGKGRTCFLEKNLHRRGRLANIEKYYRK